MSSSDNRQSHAGHQPEADRALHTEVTDVLTALARLFRAELELGSREIPDLVLLWLLRIPVLLLLWCSFSALLAWSAYALTGQAFTGFLLLFLLQCLLVIVLTGIEKRKQQLASLPETRRHLQRLRQLVEQADA